MSKGDGRTCQTKFNESISYLGIHSVCERIPDAAKAQSARVGRVHADFEFKHLNYGSAVECKETAYPKGFKFAGILPHQLARSERYTKGGIHYTYIVLDLNAMAMYALPAVALFWHQQKVRRSYITWEELIAWRLVRRPTHYDLSLLEEIVKTPVAELLYWANVYEGEAVEVFQGELLTD